MTTTPPTPAQPADAQPPSLRSCLASVLEGRGSIEEGVAVQLGKAEWLARRPG